MRKNELADGKEEKGTVSVLELVEALKCSCSSTPLMECKNCRYNSTEYIAIDSAAYDYILADEMLEDGTKVFRICDTEKMAKASIEALEGLTREVDDGR